MSVRLVDNSSKVLDTINSSVNRALTRLGLTMVEVITNYMLSNYGRPIYLTGDLLRSITFNVNLATKTVTVGSNLQYSVFVHEGTLKQPARAFIRDALLENKQIWEDIISEELGQGFKLSIV